MNKTRLINKSILIRTVKTALAALLAIIVSQELSLDFAAAAGIIAILNIYYLDMNKGLASLLKVSPDLLIKLEYVLQLLVLELPTFLLQ